MTTPYRLFFLFYGGIHMAGGLFIIVHPPLTSAFLNTALTGGAAVLTGFLSFFAGLAFSGFSVIKTMEVRLTFIKLTIAGNILYGLIHIYNSMAGYSPAHMLYIGIIAPALISLLLYLLMRREQRQGW